MLWDFSFVSGRENRYYLWRGGEIRILMSSS